MKHPDGVFLFCFESFCKNKNVVVYTPNMILDKISLEPNIFIVNESKIAITPEEDDVTN